MVRTRFFKRRAVRVALPSLALCSVLAGIALFAGSTAAAATCTGSGSPLKCSNALDGTVTIASGGLTLTAADLTWGSITLDGTTMHKAATGAGDGSFTVSDLTGAGIGWTVTATATAFCTGADRSCTNATSTLAGPLEFNGSNTAYGSTDPTAVCTGSSTCTHATQDTPAAYPRTITNIPATPVTIYAAKTGTGLGSNDVPSGWWLTIQPNTPAGDYESTITVAVNAGP